MPKHKKKKAAARGAKAKVVKTTPARKSVVPKSAGPSAIRKEITHEMIAKRAYEIFLGGRGGDEVHNWLAAERELRGL